MGRKKEEIPKLKDRHIFVVVFIDMDSEYIELVGAGYDYKKVLKRCMDFDKKIRLNRSSAQYDVLQVPLVVEE